MPRYKLIIEYDGHGFVGWQIQDNGPSVQAALAEAIYGFCGERTQPIGAGRTDAGVHALGQVAHVDLGETWRTDTVRDAINHHLRPAAVSVLSVEEVGDDFDARFSARARHYRYRIMVRRAPLALEGGRVWRVPVALDVARMHEAAHALVGTHDFTTFRAAQCQAKSPVKTIDRLDVAHVGEEIHVHASARSFMHNQVRSFVGSLKLIGEGKWSRQDLAGALEARDRKRCGPVAPAHGLYLRAVDY